ncbi:hypothetical protein CC85DRAFT_48338 [Cutaneotrichosporon oleaginosum]|uniref:Uncharacterized protein n=1 Tax=Cutaneotrichosporon oleaginosum TaxID=879819 RepID=A0A0J0XR12_9TREE|nr:uncharacterized protein CC85DRAFT_48338 [Cutaneotrichosporon oleaginosum]KLT43510.1 hypothetical protein CC85DRAFT_48338 [Cutaneotrichosporon oleaginosum]TXT05591.1 hypothetical protein COLE_06911 [Cutaneotrichosporon oleaginosum]
MKGTVPSWGTSVTGLVGTRGSVCVRYSVQDGGRRTGERGGKWTVPIAWSIMTTSEHLMTERSGLTQCGGDRSIRGSVGDADRIGGRGQRGQPGVCGRLGDYGCLRTIERELDTHASGTNDGGGGPQYGGWRAQRLVVALRTVESITVTAGHRPHRVLSRRQTHPNSSSSCRSATAMRPTRWATAMCGDQVRPPTIVHALTLL